MRDKGIDKGLIREFDDSKREFRGQTKGFYGFRKMFRDYLTKLNVAFYDPCCPAVTADGMFPVRYNETAGQLEYYNGTEWDESLGGGVDGLRSYNEPQVQSYSSPSAINATATATAAQIKTGLITSTSAAATTITTPTATQLGTALGATRGSTFDFVVDNSQGANTVTLVVGTGITVASALTGGTTLTVVSGASGVAVFRLIFKSATTANLARLV